MTLNFLMALKSYRRIIIYLRRPDMKCNVGFTARIDCATKGRISFPPLGFIYEIRQEHWKKLASLQKTVFSSEDKV